MGKPRMIILIRHGQSEGNKNRDIHQSIPDHRVKLTPEGWTQAHEAGRRLRSLLRADDTLHFFTSPYRRTRETTEGILTTLTSDEPSPSPFPRHSIKVYEEPRLREQDFGNFQPCSAEMERMWQERADYGHFFYRIPNGESAADAYDRISGFNESLWRQFGENDFASVCVLVTHGLMSRVFLMKWYHFSVEYFEDLRNVNHCEFLIMRKKEDSGKYILENNLRTWSQLKHERLAALKEKERAERENGASESPSTKLNGQGKISEKDKEKEKKLEAATSIPQMKKRWGGCPNGCDHSKHYFKKENSMHAMQLNGRLSSTSSTFNSPIASPITGPPEDLTFRRPNTRRWQSSSDEDEDDPRGFTQTHQTDIRKSLDEIVSSPDGKPNFISPEERLRSRIKSPKTDDLLVKKGGRDFGGSASGHSSQVGSETEFSAEEDARQRLSLSSVKGRKAVDGDWAGGNVMGGGAKPDRSPYSIAGNSRREENLMGRGAMADALGDQSDPETQAVEELNREETEDRSIRGSVY